jgi:hypothetical protein
MSRNDSKAGAERRRYYRVQDDIALAISPWRDKDEARLAELDCGWLATQFTNMTLDLPRRVETSQASEVWAAIHTVNNNMDMLVNWLALRDSGLSPTMTHRAELSASGIAFEYDSALSLGAFVSLRMLLFPEHRLVRLKAQVVRALATSTDSYAIALDFPEADEQEREVLVAHVLRRESEQLRVRRRD